MSDQPKDNKKPSYEELEAEVARLKSENEQLRQRVLQLEDTVEQLKRTAFRQAAPFRLPEERHNENPAPPGRKPGHPGSFRPKPDHIDQTIEVPLQRCPHCLGPVDSVSSQEQFIEEIPQPRVSVTRLITYIGRCPRCGEVRSRHPLQVSEATGCAGTHLGPRALGLAAELNKKLGLTLAKTCRVLGFWGLKITRGGLSQALERVASRMEPLYQEMGAAIRTSPAVYADETSWWVGGPGYWLWVFAQQKMTYYRVDQTRGSIVVEDVLGSDFGGTLISDCLSSYDLIQCRKQKCYSHHLRALSESLETVPAEHAGPLKTLKSLLLAALVLARQRATRSEEDFRQVMSRVQHGVESVLASAYTGPGVEKALHRFRTHREHLFTFVGQPEVDPTNNLAERQLRPAVIARKASCGNRTESGKRTWQILASIGATCQQRAVSFAELVARSMPLAAPPPRLADIPG